MFRHLAICLLAAAVAASPPGPARSAPPASAPAKEDPLRIDHVERLLEAYDVEAERNAFFEAAGVDGELSPQEFGASNRKPHTFVRCYEHWWMAKGHDLDNSGALNWPEAEKYRAAIKQDLLKRYDRDKNGRLLGPERVQANDYLRQRIYVRGRARLPWAVAHWDANNNNKLDEHEKLARDAWYKKQAQEKRRQDLLALWDANKNGRLDPDERAIMADAKLKAEQERLALLKRWDRDRDGKLNEKERYVMGKCSFDPRHGRVRHLLSRFDRNRNGKLDRKETKTMEEYYSKQYDQAHHQRMLRQYDKNRDGKLDARERAIMDADQKKRAAPGGGK